MPSDFISAFSILRLAVISSRVQLTICSCHVGLYNSTATSSRGRGIELCNVLYLSCHCIQSTRLRPHAIWQECLSPSSVTETQLCSRLGRITVKEQHIS